MASITYYPESIRLFIEDSAAKRLKRNSLPDKSEKSENAVEPIWNNSFNSAFLRVCRELRKGVDGQSAVETNAAMR